MWLASAFCAAHDAVWEFSNNKYLSSLVCLPVFKSDLPATQQVPQRT